jgi:hypothetical protein
MKWPNYFLLVLMVCPPAHAYLGGIEAGDGYYEGVSPSIFDVSTYNAGQYGTNNGGPGGVFEIPTLSPLFSKLDVGDVLPGNGELVSHNGLGRGSTSGLVLRSGSFALQYGDTASDGADYRYNFDSRDFDGITPGSVSTGIISLDYWICPQVEGLTTLRQSSLSVLNSAGDTIFSIGYSSRLSDTTPMLDYYDAGGWHSTSIQANQSGFDQVSLSFDLDANTISMNYYASLGGGSNHTVVTSAASAATMDTLKGLRFEAKAGTEKTTFDDFNFSVVPEPQSLILAALAGICSLVRRRRI